MSRRSPARHRSRATLRGTVIPAVLGLGFPAVSVASIALIGVVGASAATLGGLRTNDLGAASAAVSIHTTGVTATWSPVYTTAGWVLNGVTLTAPGADRFTAGEQLRIAIIDPASVQVCQVTKTTPALSATLAISRAEIDAACGATGILFNRIDRIAVSAAK